MIINNLIGGLGNQLFQISAGYAQALDENSQDRVIWGNGTYYPIAAHGYAQWQGNQDQEVDELGENIPNPTPDDNTWTDLAEQHTAHAHTADS